ncbi:hypothetical protein E2562_001961 [Oryza meyeriana var. granulata]|uniref:Uncharacterized protein n=1 Tax=Oryza meyeriana var. granulata TaxID=110450 RepID=A0A6G1C2I5_9ORYZ|nr:hypothetical protein E2562_001961 [Oryza meyeriana var. granulata]
MQRRGYAPPRVRADREEEALERRGAWTMRLNGVSTSARGGGKKGGPEQGGLSPLPGRGRRTGFGGAKRWVEDVGLRCAEDDVATPRSL